MNNLGLVEQILTTQAKENLCRSDDVFLAIGYNAVYVFLYVKNMGHLAAIYIAFGGWNAKDFGE